MSRIRWAFNTRSWNPTQSQWMCCAQSIQVEERDRIGKFVFRKDAKSAMIGRMMIRKGICDCLGIPFNEIQLSRTDRGKPILQNAVSEQHQNFSFNISHQGDYVVMATEPYHQVGVDVMKLDTPRSNSVSEFFNTMKRQFTSQEWQTIRRSSAESDQLKTFYRLWCLKESYVKALGTGIGFEVQRLDYKLTSSLHADTVFMDTTLRVDAVPETEWTFEESLFNNHCVAVAVKNNVEAITEEGNISSTSTNSYRFVHLSIEELLEKAASLSDVDPEYWENFVRKPEDPSQMKKKSS